MRVHFGGQTVPVSDTPVFEMDSQIIWPMAGGTALITFEEEDGECEEEEVGRDKEVHLCPSLNTGDQGERWFS